MTATIRRMRWWDIEAVLPTEQALFPEDPWSTRAFWSELAGVPQTRHYIVADDAGDIVGYAGLASAADEGDVQTVAVREDRQGQGLGKRLLQGLLDEARERRLRDVFLEVRTDNAAAQRMYEHAGFAEVHRRRGYYQPSGTDAVVMRLRP